ncbi:MAG: FAD-binding protein [Parachlamydiaceae bacterium]|nr:FAD-binding protein [Parachlamydiaceae bacterium]
MVKLAEALKQRVDGDIHFDPVHRAVYSVDASIYEVEPLGIVIPRTKQALIDTILIAKEFHVPVIARGAATGITGGCIGKALIIDLSKYLNRILKIDYEQEYVICEPGVVQDQLNAALAEKGYRLGPDTSTGNRATIGGMLANNAAGARSLLYGTMKEHTLAVELLLASGTMLHLRTLTPEEFQNKCSQTNTEGLIYQTIQQIRENEKEEIFEKFPHLPRRSSGYNLDSLLDDTLNLSKLIAGSEGSLGIATEITLKICKKSTNLGLCVIYFDSLQKSLSAVETILKHHPTAVELIDDKIIEAGRHAPSMRGKLDWLKSSPKALLVVEFCGNSQEDVSTKLAQFADDMKQQKIGNELTLIIEPTQMACVWELRKAGLGLLLSKRSYSRAIAFLEDISIAPAQLASFMQQFSQYLASKGKTAGIYGHVGSGCMHIRPYIDLTDPKEIKLMEQMMHDVSDLVLQHNGALSGEHGDGRVRSWLNKKMFGDHLYSLFLSIKEAFDPDNRMNPGKVVNGTPFLEHLRIDPKTPIVALRTFLDFSKEGGFALAVDMCNGNGLCRKAEKVMCPSFQATGDEFHTTRARAQALRAIIHSRLPLQELTSQGIHDVMDLCLECKGCKTECPSEVDMAKMKAEFLYHYQHEHGIPLRSRLFAFIGKMNLVGSRFPRLFNKLMQSAVTKQILDWIGITKERSLPLLAEKRFSVWFKEHQQYVHTKSVVLYNDTFTEFNHPEIGKSAVHVLEALGYKVIVPEWHCCGRPALSKGLLIQAKEMAQRVLKILLPYAQQGLPIIGLEPSCLLTIKDDFVALLGADIKNLQTVIKQCTTFDEFVAQHVVEGKLPLPFTHQDKIDIKLHAHCHQKALVGTGQTLKVLRAIPNATVSEIPSGCCGLAGSFGYEKEHYALSLKIGELSLFPHVRESSAGTFIVADGVSCRSQIEHGTQSSAMHLAELLCVLKDKRR